MNLTRWDKLEITEEMLLYQKRLSIWMYQSAPYLNFRLTL